MPSDLLLEPDDDPDDEPDDEPRHRGLKVVAAILGALVVVAAIAVIAALTFSVQVSGSSMDPTLEPGDRLVADILGGGSQVQRFDLVGARVDDVGVVVKRVVGLPGDTIEVRFEGDEPQVLVRPAGSDVDQLVVNPAWGPRVAGNTTTCCTPEGRSAPAPSRATVRAGHYWVLGDNWGGSDDSRVFGFVAASDVGASLNFRVLPLAGIGRVPNAVSLRPAG